jgi:hypothetical protein
VAYLAPIGLSQPIQRVRDTVSQFQHCAPAACFMDGGDDETPFSSLGTIETHGPIVTIRASVLFIYE